ncbi:MAG: hypothetical protein ACOX6J_00720 [Oscillospiraceae bacterium]|jgi:hypothetical protein
MSNSESKDRRIRRAFLITFLVLVAAAVSSVVWFAETEGYEEYNAKLSDSFLYANSNGVLSASYEGSSGPTYLSVRDANEIYSMIRTAGSSGKIKDSQQGSVLVLSFGDGSEMMLEGDPTGSACGTCVWYKDSEGNEYSYYSESLDFDTVLEIVSSSGN